MIEIKIPLLCRSKKNSQQIFINSKTNKPFITQSKLYKDFEKQCGLYLYKYRLHINYKIKLECIFYVPDKKRRDVVNLLNAIQDVLVYYQVLEDDNYNIIQDVDGAIVYEKGRSEIIIKIKKM